MICPKCGAENAPNAKFCSQCATDLSGVAVYERPSAPAPSNEMDGAEALAIAGEKTALWSKNTMAGYSMSKRALRALQDEGKGDSEAAGIAQRGINIATAQWVIGGILLVIGIIVFISITSSMGSQPTYP